MNQAFDETFRTVLAVMALAGAASAWAAETAPDAIGVKVTPSYYTQSDGNAATDINVRVSRGPHTGWIGYYRDNSDFHQTRTGYEFTQDTGPFHVVWSGQAASGGFLGGSVNAQIGDPVYAIVAFGRTNLHTYYNLNFDPNDMMTLGLGSKQLEDTEISLYHIWDNRLDTRQRVTHLYLHRTISDGERLSVDASYKRGLNSDNVFVTGYALTVTYAWRKIFVRAARDQYVNFSNATQNRLSVGLEF